MRHITPIIEIRRELNRISIMNFGYSVFSRSRKKEMVFHRQTVMYIMHDIQGYSLYASGEICCCTNPFDHATVLHSAKTVRSELKIYEKRRENLRYWMGIVNQIMQTHRDNDDVYKFLNGEWPDDKQPIVNKIKKYLGYDENET